MTNAEVTVEELKKEIKNLKDTLRSLRTCPADYPNPCWICRKIDEVLK